MDGKRVMTKTFLSTARKGCLGKFDWSQVRVYDPIGLEMAGLTPKT